MTENEEKKTEPEAESQESGTCEPPTEAVMPPVSDEELADLRRMAEERDRLIDRLKRITADYLNSTKRLERQMEERSAYAVEGFARDLLPAADDLSRAMDALRVGASVDKIREGLELVEKQLFRSLERHGVTPIATKPGDPFDATIHEAVTVQETDQFEPNRIVQETQKGFRLHGRLLRPARVVVSAAPRAKA